MTGPYPEFQLRLPQRGPLARGLLLDEKGSNGAQKFLLHAGSPTWRDAVSSLATHAWSSHAFREGLIRDGILVESAT